MADTEKRGRGRPRKHAIPDTGPVRTEAYIPGPLRQRLERHVKRQGSSITDEITAALDAHLPKRSGRQ